MGRQGAPRPVRLILGTLFGAGVFAASSALMFNLAASAGDTGSLLSPVTNTVHSVTSGVSSGVATLTGPSSLLCQVTCGPTQQTQQQQQQQANNLQQSLCLNGTLCKTQPATNGNPSAGNTNASASTPSAPAPQPATTQANPTTPQQQAPADPPAPVAPQGIAAQTGSLVQPPPSSITLPTAAGGINFGKAPFLWPLFLGLDVVGAGAVLLALRKTWSKSVAD